MFLNRRVTSVAELRLPPELDLELYKTLHPDIAFMNDEDLAQHYKEQGSVEGILEMANDQIAPIGSVTAANRNPTSGNPTARRVSR